MTDERDEFAKAALTGMFAGGANWFDVKGNAEHAYNQAEAMLDEKHKRQAARNAVGPQVVPYDA